jgi:hypothetical protein
VNTQSQHIILFSQHGEPVTLGQSNSSPVECQCYSHVSAVAVVTHAYCAAGWEARNDEQEVAR